MRIALPPPLEKWVKSQAVKEGYQSTDEFVLQMIRRERALAARERVDDMLAKSMASGPPRPMPADYWDRIRTNAQKSARQRHKK
jgi:hypothetical protein